MNLDYLSPSKLEDYKRQLITLLKTEEQLLKPLENPNLQEVLRNKDVNEFRIVLFGEDGFEEPESEEETDVHLMKKIEQYNKVAKPSRGREKSKRNRRQNQH